MRFIFHNPHTFLWFKLSISEFIRGNKRPNKYEYLYDYIYKNENQVYVYIDELSTVSLLPKLIPKYVRQRIEYIIWAFINRLSYSKHVIISDPDDIQETDVLFSFLYGNFMHLSDETIIERELINCFKNIRAKKVIHLSHFGWSIKAASYFLNEISPNILVSEVNLARHSNYFKKYFKWYDKDVAILPFVPHEKFICHTDYQLRNNMAVATGTIAFHSNDKEFIGFFNSSALHPGRVDIFNNSTLINGFIDSHISDENRTTQANTINGYEKMLRRIKKSVSLILRLGKHCINKEYTEYNEAGRDYYKFDIVDLYNQYKMVVIPEECIDMPGIGFVEAMACGCAYIGIEHAMYKDIGLIAGQNYITYNGTIENLIEVIKYYQQNNDELSVIALNGKKYVRKHFNATVVSEIFLDRMNALIDTD
jgi:hypothetical protein